MSLSNWLIILTRNPLTCKVLPDTLYSETPSLSAADSKRLYEAVSHDYSHLASRRMQMEHLKKDEFYNALQIKFAFAVTCHKAQGGAMGCRVPGSGLYFAFYLI